MGLRVGDRTIRQRRLILDSETTSANQPDILLLPLVPLGNGVGAWGEEHGNPRRHSRRWSRDGEEAETRLTCINSTNSDFLDISSMSNIQQTHIPVSPVACT